MRVRCTFGLDALTVGRDDDTLDLPEFEVLQDLPESHHDAPLHAGLHGVLLVQAVLETNQFLHQSRHTLVHIFAQHLVAVAAYVENSHCKQRLSYLYFAFVAVRFFFFFFYVLTF